MTHINDFRLCLLGEDFEGAKRSAEQVRANAPFLALFLDSLIALEQGHELPLMETPKIAGPKFEAMRQIAQALMLPPGEDVRYSGSYVLQGPVVLNQKTIGANDRAISLALIMALEMGSPFLLSRALVYLERAPRRPLHVDAQSTLMSRYTELFHLKCAKLLSSYSDILRRRDTTMLIRAIRILAECLKSTNRESGEFLADQVKQRMRSLAELPDLDPDTAKLLILGFCKTVPLSHLATEFSQTLIEREDTLPETKFWILRSRMSNGVVKGPGTYDNVLKSLMESTALDIQTRIAYALPFAGMSAEVEQTLLSELSDRICSALNPRSLTDAVRSEGKDLHVVFVSQLISNHGIGHVLHQMLPYLSNFGVKYSLLITKKEIAGSVYLSTIKEHAENVINIHQPDGIEISESTSRAVDWIEALKADVLIDLDGYMTNHSIAIASCRPAPLNVYWIGHGGKLGIDFYDYAITDQFIANDGIEWRSGERKLSLASSFVTSGPFEYNTEAKKEDYGFAEDTFLICCFNAHDKFCATYLTLLASLCKHSSKVHLWFTQDSRTDSVGNISEFLHAQGVPAAQYSFVGRVEPKDAHYTRISVCDVALDTFYVNMASGALDCIWAECPVITLPGASFYSRICGSFNEQIGLPHFNVADKAEYLSLAKRMLDHPDELEKARSVIRANKAGSSLFSGEKFAGELAAGLKLIVERQRAGLPPKDLVVGEDT